MQPRFTLWIFTVFSICMVRIWSSVKPSFHWAVRFSNGSRQSVGQSQCKRVADRLRSFASQLCDDSKSKAINNNGGNAGAHFFLRLAFGASYFMLFERRLQEAKSNTLAPVWCFLLSKWPSANQQISSCEDSNSALTIPFSCRPMSKNTTVRGRLKGQFENVNAKKKNRADRWVKKNEA